MVKDGTPKNGTQINIQIPSGYLTLPWKSPILIGKPSINGPFSIAMLNNQMVQEFPFNQVREASWSIQFSCLLGPPAPVVTAARFIGWCRGAILEAALNESEKPGDFGQIITTSLRPNPGIMVNKRNHPKMALFQWSIIICPDIWIIEILIM